MAATNPTLMALRLLLLAALSSSASGECTAAVISANGKFDLSGCTELNLKGVAIKEGGARMLAEALTAGSELTSLNLYGNGIGSEGVRALAEVLKANSVLTTLNVYGNNIGPEGAQALAEMLRTNSALTTLGLGANQIGPEGARALAEAVKANGALNVLGLGSNLIGDDGAKAMAEALKVNEVLKAFDAGRNSIRDAGGRALAEGLRTNGALTDLFLHGNDIGPEAMAALEQVLKQPLRQRQQAKVDREELVRWAAAQGLGDQELAVLAMWGVGSVSAVHSLRGTPYDVLFPSGSGIGAYIMSFFAWPSAQVRARLFAVINAPPTGRAKEEL